MSTASRTAATSKRPAAKKPPKIRRKKDKYDIAKVEVEDCPCCGSKNLHVGVTACLEVGVECKECRLSMHRTIPDRWPRGVWIDGLAWKSNHHRLNVYTLMKAVAAWNRRPKPKKT